MRYVEAVPKTTSINHLVRVADERANPHRPPLPVFTIYKRDDTLWKPRHCSSGIHGFLGGEGRVCRAPELTDGLAVGLQKIAVYDTTTESVHKFVALGHLQAREEGVVATADSVGRDNHLLTTDSHKLGVGIDHFKRI